MANAISESQRPPGAVGAAALVEDEVAEDALAAEVDADELDELLVGELEDFELPQAPAPIPTARQERMITRRRTPASLPGWPGAGAGHPRGRR
jgi:hypothetical protein